MSNGKNSFQQEPGRAARQALDAEFAPIDLSAFDTTPDAGVLAGGGISTGGCTPGAGRAAASGLAGVSDQLAAVQNGSHELGNGEVDELMGHLLDIDAQVERTQVFLLADAIDRGILDAADAASPAGWLTGKAPCLEPAQAARVAAVAAIIRDPANAALRGVPAAGIVTVRGLQVAVREADKVAPALPRFTRQQTLGYFLAVAEPRPGTTPDGDTGPADATTIDGTPTRTHGIDQRTPGKRRADALIELIKAAQRAGDNDAGRACVKATITLPLSVLIGSLVNAGHAMGAHGHVIDADTARAMACDAQLVPMVLGTDSQPLDVGRATRLFTPATRAAIIKRDHGCTFPHCDRPAPWCEAHSPARFAPCGGPPLRCPGG